jgi:hypothetical protein
MISGESPKQKLAEATLHILKYSSHEVKPELRKDIQKDKDLLTIYLKSNNYTLDDAKKLYNKYSLE